MSVEEQKRSNRLFNQGFQVGNLQFMASVYYAGNMLSKRRKGVRGAGKGGGSVDTAAVDGVTKTGKFQ